MGEERGILSVVGENKAAKEAIGGLEAGKMAFIRELDRVLAYNISVCGLFGCIFDHLCNFGSYKREISGKSHIQSRFYAYISLNSSL